MSSALAFHEVVEAVGGLSKLAELLSTPDEPVTRQRASNWRDIGFPAVYCKRIEALSGVSVQTLRPHDWRDYWPDAGKQEIAKAAA